mmetsp:Transcript_25792/g.74478  ORF Transcript_25792/g.74478 Transcript_25792/m.74478 type:complete len:213 (-) Transcript_25792:934-1572(-)
MLFNLASSALAKSTRRAKASASAASSLPVCAPTLRNHSTVAAPYLAARAWSSALRPYMSVCARSACRASKHSSTAMRPCRAAAINAVAPLHAGALMSTCIKARCTPTTSPVAAACTRRSTCKTFAFCVSGTPKRPFKVAFGVAEGRLPGVVRKGVRGVLGECGEPSKLVRGGACGPKKSRKPSASSWPFCNRTRNLSSSSSCCWIRDSKPEM